MVSPIWRYDKFNSELSLTSTLIISADAGLPYKSSFLWLYYNARRAFNMVAYTKF